MKRHLRSAAHLFDASLAALTLGVARERPALIGYFLHSLFETRRDAISGLVRPYQPVLVSEFKAVIEYYLEHGYRVVSPDDILAGLDVEGHYLLLTFDDGYANNLLALPVLNELGVCATIFVSSNHVAEGKAFWWDVLYREGHRRGLSPSAIARQQDQLMRRPHWEAEAFLKKEFGQRALLPHGDVDRPMCESELRTIATEPNITIGNHTADHAILGLYGDADIRQQIRSCQHYVGEVTGAVPKIIAYPSGSYDERVVDIARSEGIELGVTTVQEKNSLPIAPGGRMTIARYFLEPKPAIRIHGLRSRGNIRISRALNRWCGAGQA